MSKLEMAFETIEAVLDAVDVVEIAVEIWSIFS